MPKIRKSLSAAYQAASSLAVLAGHRLLHQPMPRYAGSLRMKGLSAPVEVLRDRWGIPHIYAKQHQGRLLCTGIYPCTGAPVADGFQPPAGGRSPGRNSGTFCPLDRWMRTVDHTERGQRKPIYCSGNTVT